MTQQIKQIPVSSIILDEDIYPRKRIDQRRVAIFAENIRDGIAFDPIEVEPCPDKPGFYRHLDGSYCQMLCMASGSVSFLLYPIYKLNSLDQLP